MKVEKKKFEINKKLQIAQAIMQGIQGVQAAYASGSAIPIVGAATGPVFAALAALATGLNIAKIRNTTFEGGSSSGSVSAPSAPVPSVDVPTVQGQNSQEVTTSTQGLANSNQNKVYILQSELEASQGDSTQVSVVSKIG